MFFNVLIVEFVSSTGIWSVVDDGARESNGLFNEAMCNACETAVVWIQNQLAQNQTQDVVLQYINQVSFIACNANARIFLKYKSKNVEKLAQFCSCVKSFLVLWENPQWTAAELHPCLTLPLPSGVESSHSNQNKYSIFSVAIILFVFSLATAS